MSDIGGFNPVFVFITYTVVWLFLFGYVFYMARRQNEIRGEITELKQELQRREGANEGRAPSTPRRA